MSQPMPEPLPHDPVQQPPAADADAQAEADANFRALAHQMAALDQAGRNGAHWFFWVAGLSMVNSIIAHVGGNIHFVVGLGVMLIVDGVANNAAQQQPDRAAILKGIALGIDVLAALVVALFGWLARNRFLGVYLIGMVLYLLDGLIFFAFRSWMSVAFHGFALYWMWNGFTAFRHVRRIEQALQHGG